MVTRSPTLLWAYWIATFIGYTIFAYKFPGEAGIRQVSFFAKFLDNNGVWNYNDFVGLGLFLILVPGMAIVIWMSDVGKKRGHFSK